MKHIYIVDDDEAILKMLATTFARKGYSVATNTSGLGVINKVAGRDGQQPDLVILDNYLPALSGLVSLKFLTQDKKACEVPVILYSADPTIQEAVNSAEHPNATFLLKGSLKQLVALAEEVLGSIA